MNNGPAPQVIAAIPERARAGAVQRGEEEWPDSVRGCEDCLQGSGLVIGGWHRPDLVEVRRRRAVDKVMAGVHEIGQELVLRQVQPIIDETAPSRLEELVELGSRSCAKGERRAFDHSDVEPEPKGEGSERDLPACEGQPKAISRRQPVSSRSAHDEARRSGGGCR